MNALDVLVPAIVVLGGLIVAGWGFSCLAGRFPRNLIVGYRTRAALSSKPAWDAAHRGYAPFLITGGLVLAATGALSIVAVLAGAGGMAGPVIAVGIGVLLGALILGGVFAHRALRRHLDENGQATPAERPGRFGAGGRGGVA